MKREKQKTKYKFPFSFPAKISLLFWSNEGKDILIKTKLLLLQLHLMQHDNFSRKASFSGDVGRES